MVSKTKTNSEASSEEPRPLFVKDPRKFFFGVFLGLLAISLSLSSYYFSSFSRGECDLYVCRIPQWVPLFMLLSFIFSCLFGFFLISKKMEFFDAFVRIYLGRGFKRRKFRDIPYSDLTMFHFLSVNGNGYRHVAEFRIAKVGEQDSESWLLNNEYIPELETELYEFLRAKISGTKMAQIKRFPTTPIQKITMVCGVILGFLGPGYFWLWVGLSGKDPFPNDQPFNIVTTLVGFGVLFIGVILAYKAIRLRKNLKQS
jgi:hypothetical protein